MLDYYEGLYKEFVELSIQCNDSGEIIDNSRADFYSAHFQPINVYLMMINNPITTL